MPQDCFQPGKEFQTAMNETPVFMENLPQLKDPMLIAGFDGWGNALNVSQGTADYLIRKMNAAPFARINADLFYRYDQARPVARIENGILKGLDTPGGAYYTARSVRDLIVLSAGEPSLRWHQFVDTMMDLCREAGVKTLITLGSMYDHTLHTDRAISAIASSRDFSAELERLNVQAIDYRGPSAIHTLIQHEAQMRGIECASIWCHCPFYLEDTTHFGMMIDLGKLLANLGGFELDVRELESSWKALNKKIDMLIEASPKLQEVIREIRKSKREGARATMKASIEKGDKVINLRDFLDTT
jgi:proteasome assembly chaperone (PAC2) family protein